MSLVKAKRNGNFFPKMVSNLFDTDLFTSPNLLEFGTGLPRLNRLTNFPPINITENDKDFKIELAAPGLEKKDFKIETDNDTLTISSEKEHEKKEEKENYRRQEFSYESFSRSFQIPENSLPEKIDAKYEGGILKLTLPKKEVTIHKAKKEIKIA
jgi:HSP20 family protein